MSAIGFIFCERLYRKTAFKICEYSFFTPFANTWHTISTCGNCKISYNKERIDTVGECSI